MADLFDQPFSQALVQGIGMINQAIQYRNQLDIQRQELEMKKKQMDELDQYRTEKNKLEADKLKMQGEINELKASKGQSFSEMNAAARFFQNQASTDAMKTNLGVTPDEQKRFAAYVDLSSDAITARVKAAEEGISSALKQPTTMVLMDMYKKDPSKPNPLAGYQQEINDGTAVLQRRANYEKAHLLQAGPGAFQAVYGRGPTPDETSLTSKTTTATAPAAPLSPPPAADDLSASADALVSSFTSSGKVDEDAAATLIRQARARGGVKDAVALNAKFKVFGEDTRVRIVKKSQGAAK